LNVHNLAAPDPDAAGGGPFTACLDLGTGGIERGLGVVMTMLDEILAKIDEEMGSLDHELRIELPDRIRKAAELGDLRENAEYKSALERQQFVQARMSHLSQRQSELAQIDVKNLPSDRVGFGSRVTVKDLDMGDDFDFTIVAGDFVDFDAGQISLASPIGQGLLGARKDEEVSVSLPVGERRYRVLELLTLPQQLGMQE
jgi:transcription elongation factor GreA